MHLMNLEHVMSWKDARNFKVYFSKSRSSTGKGKEIAATSSAMSLSKFMWDKVYWPSLDYLTVAKSSI